MPKPSEIITIVAALMNDIDQVTGVATQYTNAAVLPYLNLSLNILQEIFELNDIPKTHKSSTSITLKAGATRLGFDTTPALPSDLIEIEQLFESTSGLNQWVPVDKRDFLPHRLQDGTEFSYFRIWSWQNGRIELIAANTNIDLMLDYIGSIFNTPIAITNINVNIPVTNIQTYLEFQTAALCAMFIAENETRAGILSSEAGAALDRALGIPIKGMQTIVTRRLPFRSSFKRRGAGY